MAKKKKPPEHENAERWMVSYADFMTLLFAVFVVLYGFAMSAQNQASALVEGLMESFAKMGLVEGKANDTTQIIDPMDSSVSVAASMTKPNIIPVEKSGGGGMLDFGRPKTPNNSAEDQQNEYKSENNDQESNAGSSVADAIADMAGENQMGAPLDSIREDISRALESAESEGLVAITQEEHWLNIIINDSLMFAPSSASILNRAKPVLAKIADIIYPLNNYVRVRGYTDNTIVKDEVYSSNWELSSARAISVVKFFIEDDINPHRLAIEAYAQYSPFVSNSTEKGKAQNRSVTIAISKNAYKPAQLKVIADDK